MPWFFDILTVAIKQLRMCKELAFSKRMRNSRQLPGLAAALQCSARSFSQSASCREGRVFELRTYGVQPARMMEWRAGWDSLMVELMNIRAKFSKLNGCWYTELGGLNEMNFLWEFGRFESF